MIKETYSTFEFSYPKQWKDKANLADPYGKILYKDEKNLVSFNIAPVADNDTSKFIEVLKENARRLETDKISTGENVYIFEYDTANSKEFSAYVFTKTSMYKVEAMVTEDFFKSNYDLFKKIAKSIIIKENTSNTSSSSEPVNNNTTITKQEVQYSPNTSTISQTTNTPAPYADPELSAKLRAFEQSHKGQVVTIKDLEGIMNQGGDITFNNTNIYGAAYMVLFGLTYGEKGLLAQCVFNPQQEAQKLISAVPEFGGDEVSPYFNQFQLSVKNDMEVYVYLKKNGMDFGIKFNKIGGKYYFREFTEIH